jgi:hypothetical protein
MSLLPNNSTCFFLFAAAVSIGVCWSSATAMAVKRRPAVTWSDGNPPAGDDINDFLGIDVGSKDASFAAEPLKVMKCYLKSAHGSSILIVVIMELVSSQDFLSHCCSPPNMVTLLLPKQETLRRQSFCHPFGKTVRDRTMLFVVFLLSSLEIRMPRNMLKIIYLMAIRLHVVGDLGCKLLLPILKPVSKLLM